MIHYLLKQNHLQSGRSFCWAKRWFQIQLWLGTWAPSGQELPLNTALISYCTGNNKRHGSSSIWAEGHSRGTQTGQNYGTSSIQQTALQIIHSSSWRCLGFSGFSVGRWESAQGVLIGCVSSHSRSKCAYRKNVLSVLGCWNWLKRGRERKQKKFPFVLKNVWASNQNTVVGQTAALLPRSICLSAKLMFLSHPNSAPSHPSHHEHLDCARGTDTQTLVQSQPHAMAAERISKKSIPGGCCFHQIQRWCLQSFLLTDQAAAGPGMYLVCLWKAWNSVCSFTEGCYLHTAEFYRLQETVTERQQVKQ